MAKLQGIMISATEIRDFADRSSDFGFELRVLSGLKSQGVECEHNGTYDDPVTQKPRQFDIRATIDLGIYRVRLAIECKNLRENFPLAVFQVQRTERESYHELIFSHEPQHSSHDLTSRLMDSHGDFLRLDKEYSFYPPGEYVGKSCSQIGKTQDGSLMGNDADVYEKWYQAIHSAHDLVDRANEDWETTEEKRCVTLVLPVLVVPNDRLWGIKYNSDGTRAGEPEQINRTSLYIDKFVASSDRLSGIPAHLSHLEIVTENGLTTLCTGFLTGDFPSSKAFSQEGIQAALLSKE